jgi:drug/metabolite transporter (DMT)-like permease
MGYALKLAGAAIALLLIGAFAIVLFGDIWQDVGIGAAMVVVFGGLLLVVWRQDKKDKARRAGIDELPPI